MKKRSLWLILLVLAVSVALVVGCGSQNQQSGEPAKEPEPQASEEKDVLKIAMLLPGLISDAGWNAGGYQGLMDIKEKYGDEVEVAYIENVTVATAEAALRDYAEQGYNLIIGFSFDMGDPIFKVAADYPDVYFAWSQGYKQADNIVTFDAPLQESAYLAGMLGAHLSKTGKLGYIGGMDTPPMVAALEGYKDGARSVNPDIQIIHTFPGVWSDVEKGRQTALSQIEMGVDFMMGRGDGLALGVLQACKEKGVYCVGDVSDQNPLAPDLMVTSTMWNIGADIEAMLQDIKQGTFGNKNYHLGIRDGATDIAPFHGLVPEDVAQKVLEAREKMVSGELVIEARMEITD